MTARIPSHPGLTGLLMRPDGYVAWAADGGGLDQLEQALSAWFGNARTAAAPALRGDRRKAAQATARRKTRVAQARVTAHNGTSTANACHTAGLAKVPAASTRDASTR